MVNTELCFKKSYHTFLNTVKLSIQFIFTIANTCLLLSLEICNGKYENSCSIYQYSERYGINCYAGVSSPYSLISIDMLPLWLFIM